MKQILKHTLIKSLLTACIVFSLSQSQAFGFQEPKLNWKLNNYDPSTFELWLTNEVQLSKTKIFQAISQPDANPGAVIASPSRVSPDYYYHWIRDAALTMDVVVDLYKSSNKPSEQEYLNKKIIDYIHFSRANQLTNAKQGLGEPKFYVDGQPYMKEWARPQNDGPALRAMTLIKYANYLMDNGQTEFVRKELYDGDLPTQSLIKADLEFVANHWQDPSFDLWEEVMADHFFTRIVQRTSLLQGAKLAQRLGDLAASDWYLRQAGRLESSLSSFLNSTRFNNFIPATLNYQRGLNSKNSNIDVAVLLGILRGNNHDGYLDYSDARVINTINTLLKTFTDIYDINHVANAPGVAIGRYPEDIYDGLDSQGGNPWILSTLAVAEAFYEEAIEARKGAKLSVYADQLFQKGDAYFQRVQIHANPDGSLSEQINRYNGYMTSAPDLTWNYAAVMTTFWARERARMMIFGFTDKYRKTTH